MIDVKNLPTIRGRYRHNANLGKMCWFGVGGNADVLFIPADLSDLQDFLTQIDKQVPIYVMGVGSNLLVRDGGIRGVVIRLGGGFNYITHENHDIKVGAAVLDVHVAQYAMEYSIAGLEFFAGIPGTIGGALNMNAGAYGCDVESTLVSATVINLQGEISHLSKDQIGYRYRGHNLEEKLIFVEGVFRGITGDDIEITKAISEIQSNRSTTQPIRSKTGGSTFKNPPGLSAWKLIDEAECGGLTIGDASVSQQHCNFFVNNGNATADDIAKLIIEVRQRVADKTGVMLEPEIQIIGERL